MRAGTGGEEDRMTVEVQKGKGRCGRLEETMSRTHSYSLLSTRGPEMCKPKRPVRREPEGGAYRSPRSQAAAPDLLTSQHGDLHTLRAPPFRIMQKTAFS